MTADPLEQVSQLPGVFEAAEAARGSVDALLRDLRSPGLRKRVPEVTTAALRRGSRASALLEPGVAAAAPRWADDPSVFVDPFGDDVAGRAATGALRVSTELSSLAGVWGMAPLQALARLHTLAAAADADPSELGRPRVGADPAAGGRLAGLVSLVAVGSAPAVVVAAVVHGELMAVAPFAQRNGLVARAASRLVLLSRGLDPQAASVPEEGHLELGLDAYDAALAAYRSGTPEGVASWVVHCATAVAIGGRVGREVAEHVRTAGL